ncbi:MAG: NAD-dependent deacylase [Pseudomonadota bacterium]
MKRIVILTGAGLSAESGLGTFRDKGGLWTKYDLSEVATPEGFAANPAKVHAFYNARRQNCREARPNKAHEALAELKTVLPEAVTLITQNVDDLLERAGAHQVLHMHGELMRAKCAACGAVWDQLSDMDPGDPCPSCGAQASRPDIVWFGEYPYHMEEIWAALNDADLFVAIGTSGQVHPAAAFVQDAARGGASTLELNLEDSEISRDFQERRRGPATELVPKWVVELLSDLHR